MLESRIQFADTSTMSSSANLSMRQTGPRNYTSCSIWGLRVISQPHTALKQKRGHSLIWTLSSCAPACMLLQIHIHVYIKHKQA